jgi:glycerophosphoryl diester phosphodiesterase
LPVSSVVLKDIAGQIRHHHRPLLAFHIYFAVLALVTLTPASAWLLGALVAASGQPMIGNEDLLAFVLQPAGVLWLLISATLAATLVFVEHAGMTLIAMRDPAGNPVSASRALWLVVHRLPALLELAGMQVAAHLLLAAPALLLLGGSFFWLLGEYDPYYVVHERPGELWHFLGIASLLAVLLLLLNGNLYLRWVLALPVLLSEGVRPRAALARSMTLTAGVRLPIAARVIGVGALVALLPMLVSLTFESAGAMILQILPERYGLLIPVMAGLVILFTVMGVLVAFAGVSANSLLIWLLYRALTGRTPDLPAEAVPRHAGVWAWGLEGLLVLFALGQVVWVVQAFDAPEQVQISAHRGNSSLAPENTLAAIERAIADGTHYVELDVRQTADGVLVLLHDRDLRRVAGVARDIWTVDYGEIRHLDVGSWFSAEFSGERIPTLQQAIALLRGRARLYLEIKTGTQSPNLTHDVVRTLQDAEFVADTTLAALSPQTLLEARELEPALRTSLLVHTAIGDLEAQPFDALALRDALVTPWRARRVRQQGRELHVWTVNDEAAMARFIDLGVDNIITDRPHALAALLEERDALSDAERLLLRIRQWIW